MERTMKSNSDSLDGGENDPMVENLSGDADENNLLVWVMDDGSEQVISAANAWQFKDEWIAAMAPHIRRMEVRRKSDNSVLSSWEP